MLNARVNSFAKIWIFWEDYREEKDCINTIQQITMTFQLRGGAVFQGDTSVCKMQCFRKAGALG